MKGSKLMTFLYEGERFGYNNFRKIHREGFNGSFSSRGDRLYRSRHLTLIICHFR
jgi:hypothetical protein